MLSSFQLKDFKSINNLDPILLTEYSILCGSNSSGKSSVIQALLMLSQTFSSRFSQGTIALNGHLVRLGSFSDIKNSDSETDNISINLRMDFTKSAGWNGEITSASLDFSFGKTRKSSLMEEELHPSLLRAKVTLSKEDGAIECLEFSQPSTQDEFAATNNQYQVIKFEYSEIESISKQYPDYHILGCEKDSLIPGILTVDYDHTRKISSQVIESLTGQSSRRYRNKIASDLNESEIPLPKVLFAKIRYLIENERIEAEKGFELPEEITTLIKNNKLGHDLDEKFIKQQLLNVKLGLTPDVIPDHFLEIDNTSASDWLLYINSLEDKQKKHLIEFIDKYRTILQDAWYDGVPKDRRTGRVELRAFQHAGYFFSYYFERSLKYLGPLRNEPQPVYPALGLMEPTNVGLKGEYSAAILHINRYKRIQYPSPTTNGKLLNFNIKSATLETACQDWLSYLGVVQKVLTNDKGKLGYELSVKTHTNDKWQDLTHVGVGVSQVLPIVLMSLLSEDDDILIFEQPELHLHPKVQSRLCDFFIAISSWGRQCLIETHSEYLINRLRLRVSQSRDHDILNKSSIFFLNKTDGKSNFKKVPINEFGAILDWPDDFFDQTDKEVENILIEATKKRRQTKEGSK